MPEEAGSTVIVADPGQPPSDWSRHPPLPVRQAEELYAGLREFGIPAEFACYPREGNQVSEPAHVADQRERIVRWLATHLRAPRQATADTEAAS